jgi:hypothetical protein
MNTGHKRIFWAILLALLLFAPLALPLPFKDRLAIMTTLLAVNSIILLKVITYHHTW